MMQNPISELPAEVAELLDLGSVLGQSQAFSQIAGRCSAAQAASLRCLREERKYKRVAPNWREFCSTYLRMSQTQADEIIQLWEEFGAGYFAVAQLIRISPETYRAIAPAVRDGVLHSKDDAIELTLENSRRVAAAVAELRGSLAAAKPPRQIAMHERLALLDKRCAAIVAEFEEISRKERQGENWLLFTATLMRCSAALRRIEKENGVL